MTTTCLEFSAGLEVYVTDLPGFLGEAKYVMDTDLWGADDVAEFEQHSGIFKHMDLHGKSKDYYLRWFGAILDSLDMMALGFGHTDLDEKDSVAFEHRPESGELPEAIWMVLTSKEPAAQPELIWATVARH